MHLAKNENGHFLNFPIPCKHILKHSGTPTEANTQFKNFLSGLIGKLHINFNVANVFEILFSTKKGSMIVSIVRSVQTKCESLVKH